MNVMFGLTSGVFLPSFVVFFWLVGKTNEAGIEVLAGVVHGRSIPIKTRWIWLYQVWMGYTLALVVLPFATGFALLQIAERAAEADARLLGYMYAYIFLATCFVELLAGISGFVVYASRLRQAEAD